MIHLLLYRVYGKIESLGVFSPPPHGYPIVLALFTEKKAFPSLKDSGASVINHVTICLGLYSVLFVYFSVFVPLPHSLN